MQFYHARRITAYGVHGSAILVLAHSRTADRSRPPLGARLSSRMRDVPPLSVKKLGGLQYDGWISEGLAL